MNSLIETEEICSILGIKRIDTLRSYVKKYPAMPVKKLGGRWRANADDLQEFIRNYLREGSSAATNPAPRRGRKPNPSTTTKPPGGWQVRDWTKED